MTKLRALNTALILAAILLIGYAAAAPLLRLISTGSVKTPPQIEAYWNLECTEPCTVIDWGNMTQGTNKTVLVYLKNVGGDQAVLNMTTSNWQPPQAETQLTLSWNYTGQPLQPTEVLPVEFTLAVASDTTITTFSFDIVIGIEL